MHATGTGLSLIGIITVVFNLSICIGLFHLVKLPRIKSLTCHYPETLDLAFKLKRKKFVVEVHSDYYSAIITIHITEASHST